MEHFASPALIVFKRRIYMEHLIVALHSQAFLVNM